jgi:hypothetical protein
MVLEISIPSPLTNKAMKLLRDSHLGHVPGSSSFTSLKVIRKLTSCDSYLPAKGCFPSAHERDLAKDDNENGQDDGEEDILH